MLCEHNTVRHLSVIKQIYFKLLLLFNVFKNSNFIVKFGLIVLSVPKILPVFIST